MDATTLFSFLHIPAKQIMSIVVCSKILDCIDKRTLGKGFLALLISSWTIKKIYAQIQILKNVKKIELKRKETDRRKRSLEER